MSSLDPANIYTRDPSDNVFISKKHWARKLNIEQPNALAGVIGRPGPIAGIVLTLFDNIVSIILKLIFYMFDICQYAFDWIMNLTFGNFQGLIPQSWSKGKVISTKFFRYTMNVLMPPFGIMLSKGLYGWFSVLICCIITYVNFIAGIVYTFIITSRNRYADQYENVQTAIFTKKYPQGEANDDVSAFFSSLSFVGMLGLLFFFIFSYF
jgi:uncharacterized membrane protein YqaE (UPF0057 family)